jgi:hypothetical protein
MNERKQQSCIVINYSNILLEILGKSKNIDIQYSMSSGLDSNTAFPFKIKTKESYLRNRSWRPKGL